jgi:hypothetical protein
MKKHPIYLTALTAIMLFNCDAIAAETTTNTGIAPIFITPTTSDNSTQSTTTSSPIFIQPITQQNTRSNQRVYTTPGRRSYGQGNTSNQSIFVKSKNPFEGTRFGRIRTEIDYYDKETDQKYNQYEYMALLQERGETEKLNAVRSYIQKKGVFNPEKYNNTMMGTSSSGGGKNASTTSGAANTQQQTHSIIRQSGTKSSPLVSGEKIQGTNMPQKLHADYDTPSVPTPPQQNKTEQSSSSNGPIFLR